MQKLSRRKLARYIAAELANDKADIKQLAKRVAAYLYEHKQQKSIELVTHDVADVLAKEYGRVFVEVTSARELSAALREHIMRYVTDKSGTATVELDEHVDPALIGGVILRLPDQELDTSIRTKLTKLRSV